MTFSCSRPLPNSRAIEHGLVLCLLTRPGTTARRSPAPPHGTATPWRAVRPVARGTPPATRERASRSPPRWRPDRLDRTPPCTCSLARTTAYQAGPSRRRSSTCSPPRRCSPRPAAARAVAASAVGGVLSVTTSTRPRSPRRARPPATAGRAAPLGRRNPPTSAPRWAAPGAGAGPHAVARAVLQVGQPDGRRRDQPDEPRVL